MNNTKPVAISYQRWSSGRQSKGDSRRRQTSGAADWCQRNGYRLAHEYTDAGVSAWKGDNRSKGSLGHLLDAIKAGHIPAGAVLIVEAGDRLSREGVMPTLTLINEVVSAGVEMRFLHGPNKERRVTRASLNDLAFMITIVVEAHAAADLSEKISMRVRESWVARREDAFDGKGLSSRCPSWLVPTDGNGYEINKDLAAIVKRIFERAALGHGPNKIATELKIGRAHV